jgi:hypothetical protein
MECNHTEIESVQSKAIFDARIKILHKVFVKMHTYIKTSGDGSIDHHNCGFYLQMIMREMNKTKLKGFEKRDLAQSIMILLLDSLGLPHIVSYYTSEIILDMIEVIYNSKMHKFRRSKRCILL